MKRYPIVRQPEPDDGGYSVTVPALPGCFPQGDTFDEVKENLCQKNVSRPVFRRSKLPDVRTVSNPIGYSAR